MPDYTAIRAQLEDELGKLVARVEEIDAGLSEPGNVDWEEQATETEGDEVLSSMRSLSLTEIDKIKQALHQIDAGTYGTCTRCGVTIPNERLEILPYATTCTGCA